MEIGDGEGKTDEVGAEDKRGTDGVRIVESDGSGVTVELVTSGFKTDSVEVKGQAYQRISIPSYSHGYTAMKGFPRLPIKGVLVEVPEKSTFSLEILDSEEETYSGYFLYPVPLYQAQGGQGRSRYLAEQFTLDEGAYSDDRFHPGSPVELGNVGYLRDQRVVQLKFYPIQFDPVTGTIKLHKRIRVRMNFHASASVQLSFQSQAMADPLSFDGSVYKLSIRETGVYRLSYDYLASNAPEVLSEPSSTLKLYNKGQEVALRVEGEFIEFYAVVEDTRYADTNVYWLTAGGLDGKRMEEVQVDVASPLGPDSSWSVVHFEENEDYWGDIPGDENTDRWFYGAYIGRTPKDLHQRKPR
jgi:hypothetical protein